MKKYLHLFAPAMLLSFLVPVASALIPPASTAFWDLNQGMPHYDAIVYAEEHGIVSGYPDGSFQAENRINRAEFTKILVEAALDYSPDTDPSGYDIYSLSGLSFGDLEDGAWYVPYLRKAVQAGVISGYPDGTFKPGSDINFAEAAKIIVEAYGYETGTDAVWYKPYVDALAERGAIPTSVTGFDYKINRGEMVEMIYRLLEGITDQPSLNYSELAQEVTLPSGTFSRDENHNYSGTAYLRGYATVSQVEEPFCDQDCQIYDYVFFHVLDSGNAMLDEFLLDFAGNSFVGENSVGLGCVVDGGIVYENNSDQSGYQEDLSVAPADAQAILSSSLEAPVTIKAEKYLLTGGGEAFACYSHFSTVSLYEAS